MPDIEIGITVTGADQAASQLQALGDSTSGISNNTAGAASGLSSVGDAADNAGTKASTAGSSFASLGQSIFGITAGIGLTANGFFAMTDAIDQNQRAQDRAARAGTGVERAQKALSDAVAKYNKDLESSRTGTDGVAKAQDGLNSAIQAYNKSQFNAHSWQPGDPKLADKVREAQQKLNDEVAKSHGPNDTLQKDTANIALKQQGLADAQNRLKDTTKQAETAQQQLGFRIVAGTAEMAGGLGMIASFGKGLLGMGQNAGESEKGVSKLGSALSSGNLLTAGLVIAGIAAAYFILKNNVGGSLDAVNNFETAIVKAVPGLTPFLNLINGLAMMMGIGGDFNTGLKLVTSSIKQIQDMFGPLGQKLAEASGAFQTFFSQLSKGDVAGAFTTLAQSISKVVQDIMSAFKSINWTQVWQGLQDAFSSSIKWMTTAAQGLGGTIGNFIKNWNWGDAWKSLQDAFWASVKFLTNITLPITAGIQWLIGNVISPGIDELKKHLPTWPQITQAIGLAITWFIKNVVNPTVEEIKKNLPIWTQTFINYAGIALNWFIKNVVDPTLEEIKKQLPVYANAIQNGVPMIILWAVTGKVDPSKQEIAKWAPQIGSQDVFIPMLLNWGITGKKDPSDKDVAASKPIFRQQTQEVGLDLLYKILGVTPPPSVKPPTIPKLSTEVGLDIKTKLERFDMPKLDTAVSGLYDGISSAIKNAPTAGTKIGDAIKSAIFSFWPKSVDAKGHPIGVTGLQMSSDPVAMIASFTQWFSANMPKSMKSAQALEIQWASIDWSGMQNALMNATKDIGAFIQNSLRNEMAKIPLIGSSLASAFPPIKFTAEVELGDTYKKIDELKAKLNDPTLTKQQRIDILLNISDLEKKLPGLWADYNKIPKELLSTFKADTTKASTDASGYKKQSLDTIPGFVTTKVSLDTNQLQAQAPAARNTLAQNIPISYTTKASLDYTNVVATAPQVGGIIRTSVPSSATTTIDINTLLARIALGQYNPLLKQSVPDQKGTSISANTSLAQTALSVLWTNYLLKFVPDQKIVTISVDTSLAQSALSVLYTQYILAYLPDQKVISIVVDTSNVASSVAGVAAFLATQLLSLTISTSVDDTGAIRDISILQTALSKVPLSIMTTFKFEDSAAIAEISRLKTELAGLMNLGGGGVITLHAAFGGAFLAKAEGAIASAMSQAIRSQSSGAGGSAIPISGYQSGGGASPPISGSTGGTGPNLPGQSTYDTEGTHIGPTYGGTAQFIGGTQVYGPGTDGLYRQVNTDAPIARAAQGGSFIVDRPTMLGKNLQVGEAGPELIQYADLGKGWNFINVIPLTGTHAPPALQQHKFRDGGSALVESDVGNRLGSFLSSYSSTISDFDKQSSAMGRSSSDPDRYYMLIEKLMKLITQSNLGNKNLNANLFVDGRKMAANTSRYLGANSYGDR